MDKIIRILIGVVLLALLLALLLPARDVAAAEDPDATTQRLIDAETDRIAAINRFASAKVAPAPPPRPRAIGAPSAICGAAFTRRVAVASSDQLRAALAAARPGDLIQLDDGIYRAARSAGDAPAPFVAAVSGTADRPITLCGSRAAILEGRSIESGNGFTLTADHWVLSGFGVRNARKGIVVDGGRHNILRALEVSQIGEEGVHFRRFSTDNLLEHSWVHHVGQLTPIYGEGVYVGSAHSNWPTYTQGRPDTCDRNRVIGNLIGPSTTAESVDIKEGSTGGVVADNTFLGVGMTAADSWVDVKGNGYVVSGNAGLSTQGSGFKRIEINQALPGWGLNNDVRDNAAQVATPNGAVPFRAASDDGGGPATIVVPARAMPYRLSELIARLPESIEPAAPGTWLLKEHILVAHGARLAITSQDARELRLLSDDAGFVSIVAFRGQLAISGVDHERMVIRSWNPAANGPDQIHRDGRAYILVRGGRMDIDQADFSELGFGIGHSSGVAWQGLSDEKSLGNVTGARFERNFYGAYTYQSEAMRWVGNRFADNVGYGFDPHDFSNHFLFEDNTASNNGTHGIIFSRGCSGNIIRRNSSFGNRGFGIMLDDGKVRDDGNPRHARAVPSDDNIMEENRVWGNAIGIALEGGARNVIRANDIHDNQFGISIKDNVRASEIVSNTIRASASFAIYIYNQSHQNRIIGNVLDGGKSGIVIKESVANVIQGNTITGIRGRGLVLVGETTNTVIAHNTLAGQGSNAIDSIRASGLAANALGDNQTDGWTTTGPPTLMERVTNFIWHRPALLIWATFLLLPLLTWWPARRRRLALLRDLISRILSGEAGSLIGTMALPELKPARVAVRGRAFTIVVVAFMIVLIVPAFGWIGARQINAFFSTRGDQAMQLQDFQAARGHYTWAIRFNPSDAHAYLTRGYALQNLNNDELALSDFSRYTDLLPAEASGYVARATSELRLGRAEAAIADFSAAITRDTSSASGYAGRARAYADLGKWQPAAADMSAALRIAPSQAGYLIDRARYFGQLGQLARALADADSALALAPDSEKVSILITRSDLRERKGDLAGAQADLDHAIAQQKPSAALFARRAAYYERHGDDNHALADYQRAIQIDSTLEWVQTKLGLLHAQQGDLAADASLSRVITITSRDAAAYQRQAELLLAAGHYDDALANVRRALDFAPSSAIVFLTRARLYHAIGKLAEANADVSHAIELDDARAPAYLARARIARDQGQRSMAFQDLDRAIQLDPAYAAAYAERAALYTSQQSYDAALSDYDEAIAQQPDDAALLIARGRVYRASGDLTSAKEDFTRATRVDMPAPDGLIELGALAANMGEGELAMRSFDQALALGASDARVFAARGRVLADQGKLQAAAADLDRALALRPDDPPTLLARGRVYTQLGRDDAALGDFTRALALDPRNTNALLARARYYSQRANFELALKDADAALALRPNDGDTLLGRARIYALQGDITHALSDAGQVLALNPSNLEARVLSARLYQKTPLTGEALEMLNQVLMVEPQNVAAYRQRAELRRQRGDLVGAQEDLERALALLPGNTDLALRQAAVLEQQGKLSEALVLYGQVIAVSGEPSPLYLHAGKLRYSLKQYRRALANFQAALERKPDNGPAYRGIGLVQRQLRNVPAARAAFKQYLQLTPAAPDRAEIVAWMRKHGR